ncbi:MAG TPA: GAF domain-containing protein, partial [Terracidiphilus sp.]|nr:GAF domain-containing protein [Terracidiphilus sp.]
MPEKRAQIILEVAQVIGNQLEMSELLGSLNEALTPIIHFDAIGIVILKGETVTPYWAHVEGVSCQRGESVESFVNRYASSIKVDPLPMQIPVSHHPISEIMKSGEPYIAPDLESERRFDSDEPLFNARFRSYIDLPLIKQGQLIGTIKFLSWQKGSYTAAQVRLLQDIANIVAIAVSNALAYEEIKSLKEQLLLENRVLQEDIVQRSIYEEIVGSSGSLQKVLAAI